MDWETWNTGVKGYCPHDQSYIWYISGNWSGYREVIACLFREGSVIQIYDNFPTVDIAKEWVNLKVSDGYIVPGDPVFPIVLPEGPDRFNREDPLEDLLSKKPTRHMVRVEEAKKILIQGLKKVSHGYLLENVIRQALVELGVPLDEQHYDLVRESNSGDVETSLPRESR